MEYVSQSGATRLKQMLESYWRERGYEVEVKIVDGGFSPAVRCGRFDIRSDMLNGFPTRLVEEPLQDPQVNP